MTPDLETLHAELTRALPDHDRLKIPRCAERLRAILAAHREGEAATALVGFGGGKDSAFVTALTRLIQLHLLKQDGETFRLRVVIHMHAGMTHDVLKNIHTVYQRLHMLRDPLVDLVVVDQGRVRSYSPLLQPSGELREETRSAVLMAGHRSFGDARATMCVSCNLRMLHSFDAAIAHEEPPTVMITGDSTYELRAYWRWTRSCEQKTGMPRSAPPRSLGEFLTHMDRLRTVFRADVLSEKDRQDSVPERLDASVRRPMLFSLFEEITYDAKEHWPFITDCLQMRFDHPACAFSETDCAFPIIMAHLHGVRGEALAGCRYEDAVADYVRHGEQLMQEKGFPPELLEISQKRYGDIRNVSSMRRQAEELARALLAIEPEHLVCMVYSPFCREGRLLARYLAREHPHLLDQTEAWRKHLADMTQRGSSELSSLMQTVSGLTVGQMRHLYYSEYALDESGRVTNRCKLAGLCSGDPYRRRIPEVSAHPGIEFISGR